MLPPCPTLSLIFCPPRSKLSRPIPRLRLPVLAGTYEARPPDFSVNTPLLLITEKVCPYLVNAEMSS